MPPRGPSQSLGFGQLQGQRQSLTITPQLRQAIELLQLSNLELSTFLENAVETNPMLTLDDGLREGAALSGGEQGREAGDAGDAGDDASLRPLSGDAREEAGPVSETDGDNLWNGDGAGVGAGPGASEQAPGAGSGRLGEAPGGRSAGSGALRGRDDLPDLAERIADRPTLGAAIDAQILMVFDDPADRIIARLIASRLDAVGYLREEPVDVALPARATAERVWAVYRRLRTFEPTGIFARDLADCLALQLEEADLLDPPMQALLDNLDLLAAGGHDQLRRLCGVSEARLSAMIAALRRLEPRPAGRYDTDVARPIIPDLLIEDTKTGWRVSLNTATQPRLLIDKSFAESVRRSRDSGARQYVRDQLQEANWLVRALEQRARTLVKVGAEIVRHQQGFFDRGVEAMKPLVLRQVAEAIEMHESTVSRATSGKYVETPRGVFELRFFFSAAVGGESGEAQAAAAIRHRIRTLIEGETKALSDDKIVRLLHQAGFDVARRTVAKYREAMRIPSSVERRRQKALALAG